MAMSCIIFENYSMSHLSLRMLDSNEGSARNFTQNCNAYLQEDPEGEG